MGGSMKKDLRIAVFLVFFLIILSSLIPTTTYATNGHQLSAIGAYQQGMGGAVTAAPYDSSTSISNPAGMALIGNRTDFSFQTFFPHREAEFTGGGKTSGGSNWYLVPAIGWTAPVSDRNDLFFGGGMYGVSGMGVDFDTVSTPGFFLGAGDQAHIYSQYQFWKMAPTVAWKTGKLALGFALNLDYQAFGFEQYFTNPTAPGVRAGFDLSEMQGALGYGATVGFIYEFATTFSAGASYSTKQNFQDFKWRLSSGDVLTPDGANLDGIYRMDLDFPQQWAIGIAVRPIRTVLWTADIKWINYHDTYNIVYLRGPFSSGAQQTPLEFGWNDVWVYATGLQIDVTPNFAIRAGYNFSQSPIKEEDVENNLAFPAIVEQRVAGGFTYRLGRHWEITMAYMKAFKEEMTGASGTKISLEEQAADIELSYRF